MKNMRKIISYLLLAIVAVVWFLLMLNIHFESDLIEMFFTEIGVVPFDVAPYVLRILVGLGWATSLLVVIPNRFSQQFIKLVLTVSIIWLSYLLYESNFSEKNCGVLSLYILNPQKEIQYTIAIIVLVILSFIVNGSNFKVLSNKIENLITPLLVLTTVVLSFLFNPLVRETKVVNNATYLPVELLYENMDYIKPAKDLTKGKYIIAFMSYTCPYCKTAAKKINLLKKQNSNLPFYIVVGGKPENEKQFFDKTCLQGVDYFNNPENDVFWKLAGDRIPAIYLIDNGKIYRQIHYSALNKKELENWIDQ
jgi:hypothetical protein